MTRYLKRIKKAIERWVAAESKHPLPSLSMPVKSACLATAGILQILGLYVLWSFENAALASLLVLFLAGLGLNIIAAVSSEFREHFIARPLLGYIGAFLFVLNGAEKLFKLVIAIASTNRRRTHQYDIVGLFNCGWNLFGFLLWGSVKKSYKHCCAEINQDLLDALVEYESKCMRTTIYALFFARTLALWATTLGQYPFSFARWFIGTLGLKWLVEKLLP